MVQQLSKASPFSASCCHAAHILSTSERKQLKTHTMHIFLGSVYVYVPSLDDTSWMDSGKEISFGCWSFSSGKVAFMSSSVCKMLRKC